MKINISRPNIYLLILSIFLLIFVFVFSFAVLIPEGKEYRKQRSELKKERRAALRYQNFNNETSELLKTLKSDNREVLTAFERAFNEKRFQKQHSNYFSSLSISKESSAIVDDEFSIYEVNTTSQISSPQSFYDFLDALNKSDWIISVNFPINFKRDGELIKSTFTMKVYATLKDSNSTK